MAFELIASPFWKTPSLLSSSLWEEDEALLPSTTSINSLSISEDEKNIFVEAAVPGLNSKEVEVTFDKGILWIKGEKIEEEKKKKYYRKATSSFSYRIIVPGEIDQNIEPTAEVKNGIATVTFTKFAKSQPKKIAVKPNK